MNNRIYLINSKSCLFYNIKKGLIRINCPFVVLCIFEISDFKIGDKLNVDSVGATKNNNIVYVILSKPYPHKYFILILD